MVDEKPKKVVKKSAGKAERSSKKTTVQKKKSPVKKVTTSKEKNPIAKKVTKKPAEKSKLKVSSVKKTESAKVKTPVAKKKPVKKNLKKVVTKENVDLKIKKASTAELKTLENVINKLSRNKEQHYITTVPGVLRKMPAVQETTEVHKEVPIKGILNYLKKMF